VIIVLKGEQKKAHIMETTRDLILDKGINWVSMAKVSKATNVPVGTIYYIFKDKDDLINQIYMASRDKIFDIDYGIYESYKDAFRHFFYEYVHRCRTYHQDFLFVSMFQLSPIVDSSNWMDFNFEIGNYSFSKAIEEGVVKEIPAKLVDGFMLGMINKVLELNILGHLPDEDFNENILFESCWNSMKKDA
jgi:AcrR family transcriptional regulator